jgi:hypothetical protein
MCYDISPPCRHAPTHLDLSISLDFSVHVRGVFPHFAAFSTTACMQSIHQHLTCIDCQQLDPDTF